MIFNPRIQKSVGPVGTQISTLEVGTLVKMNINGAPWEWRVVNQGLPGSMYDSSCDGCWLLLENIHSTRIWDSTNNDYKNSDIHTWLQNSFLPMLDPGIQSQIKQVKIPYVNGTGGSPVVSGANGLSCKIFLLGVYEVGFDASASRYLPVDGQKLAYFDLGIGTVANNKRIAYLDSSATTWATRSVPTLDYTFTGVGVRYGGIVDDIDDLTTSPYGIRPALILPSTALVDTDLNLIEEVA